MSGDLYRDWKGIAAEQDEWSMPADLERTLREHGLAVVSVVDNGVLQKSDALPEKQLRRVLLGHPFRASHQLREFAKAVLARRASQDGQQIAGNTPDQPENKPDSR